MREPKQKEQYKCSWDMFIVKCFSKDVKCHFSEKASIIVPKL